MFFSTNSSRTSDILPLFKIIRSSTIYVKTMPFHRRCIHLRKWILTTYSLLHPLKNGMVPVVQIQKLISELRQSRQKPSDVATPVGAIRQWLAPTSTSEAPSRWDVAAGSGKKGSWYGHPQQQLSWFVI